MLLEKGTKLLDEDMKGRIDQTLPKTDEFVMNNRNQKLHVRTSFPTSTSCCKGIIVYLHGYAAHGNRPTLRPIMNSYNDEEYAILTLDFHGHGYSSSDDAPRALVNNAIDLIDDVLCVLRALYYDKEKDCDENRLLFHLNHHHSNNNDLPKFYIMGHSMGGGIAILVADLLSSKDNAHQATPYYQKHIEHMESTLVPKFAGCLLFCPLIYTKVPSVLFKLLYPLSVLFPMSSMPTALLNENDYNEGTWSSPIYREYIKNDGGHNGCSYSGNIRFGTMQGMQSIAKYAQRAIRRGINCPFVVFHDTHDSTVDVKGSLEMTANAINQQTQIMITVPNGLHDLLANKLEFCIQRSLKWLNYNEQQRQQTR